MAKATKRKLKVFQTQLGFYDSVVAASSKAAALRAWGIRRDLFAQGLASVATDEAAIEAALACPDIALKRPAGSTDPYSVAPARPKVSEVDPGGHTAAKPQEAAAPTSEPPRKPPDRSKLDAAEADLERLDGEHEDEAYRLRAELEDILAEEESLRKRKSQLMTRREQAEKTWRARRAELDMAVARERRSFRLAGSKD